MCLRNGTTPVELRQCRGSWTLELYELAAVASGVYRPRCCCVEGEAAILAYLAEHRVGPPLSRITARLMQRYRGRDCEFQSLNGAWLPVNQPPGLLANERRSTLRNRELGFARRSVR